MADEEAQGQMLDEDIDSVVRTTRDDNVIRERLQSYLASQLPGGANPQVSEISSPSASGMSSETLLFDATWTEAGGGAGGGAFVGRMAPVSYTHLTLPTN